MMWDLPMSVTIDGKEYVIRNKCDYRMVLDVIGALNDEELDTQEKLQCALFIFYEDDMTKCVNLEQAVIEMFRIINNGEDDEEQDTSKPQLMDWHHDFKQLAPPISRTLGYDVRMPDKYTHWWSFIGAYMEIGECTFSNIISIRSKKAKGIKLDKWEEEFYRQNRKMVNLPLKLTAEEQALLDSDW